MSALLPSRSDSRRSAFVPTVRAALMLAACAPLALIVAAVSPQLWVIAPVVGVLLVLLVLADAWLAGRLTDMSIHAPSDIEVGEGGQIEAEIWLRSGRPGQMEMALRCDPRLASRGRMLLSLSPVDGRWSGVGVFTPSRRGTGIIDAVWLRWSGPLGLGARQFQGVVDHAVRVSPNLAATRSPSLQTFLRDSQYGLIARRIRGEGTQFESLADFQPGMDRRRIDWKSSARHVHLYAKEYEAERNNQIVFALDCGQAMCEPIAGLPRIDRAVSAALATAFVALKGGDRVSLFGFASHPQGRTPFVASSSEFYRLQRAAASLEYRSEEPNFTLALATLATGLQRRSLIVIFSDFSDPGSAELMIEGAGRLVTRHVVLFVTMADEELEALSTAPPEDMEALSMAVTADGLLRQRMLALRRLRQLGIDVVEAPWDQIGTRLIDAYLSIKRTGAIG